MNIPFDTTTNIILSLMGITIAIFIFAVTLLGNAIKKAEDKKKEIEEESKKVFDEKIIKIGEELADAKKSKSGDISKLSFEIAKLEKNKKEAENKIKKIQERYTLISLQKGVVYPSSFFVVALILNTSSSFINLSLSSGLIEQNG